MNQRSDLRGLPTKNKTLELDLIRIKVVIAIKSGLYQTAGMSRLSKDINPDQAKREKKSAEHFKDC